MAAFLRPVEREILDPDAKASRLARMVEIEDEVFQTAAGVLSATLDACHVTPNQEEPPPDWVERYGKDAADKRLTVAKAGWMPRSLAPNFIAVAGQIYSAIARARRHASAAIGPREINVKMALPAPTSAGMPGAPEYPSKEVE